MFQIPHTAEVGEVSVEELFVALKDPTGKSFVDVREDDEWSDGHIDGFVHMPLGEISERHTELDQNNVVYLLCASGGRSRRAALELQELGFLHTINIQGGIHEWLTHGLPATSGL
jgi:rhodanese-related sulfurtransferase